MYSVYILHSASLAKFYVGSTEHLETRLAEHNRGKSTFTRTGKPWKLVFHQECPDRSAALQQEMKIKSRGIQRFLHDQGISFNRSPE